MAITLLPNLFVLESGGRYLSLTDNLSPGVPSGFLKFDEEQIWNPRVKFAVERSEDGQLVHIRSCYNNKYWEALPDGTRVLSASGKKREEDQSKVSCTLFELHPVPGNTGALRLRFVQNGMYAGRLLPHGTTNVAIHDGVTVSPITWPSDFNVINWETLVILPTQVSFRSDQLNGNYLVSRPLDPRWPYQRFEPGIDGRDPRVAKELFPTPNGNYRIKDVHFGKFWRRSPNWIWADGEDDNLSDDTLFSVVKISDTVIALCNLGNNNFCGGLAMDGKTDCLNAQYPTISEQARLVIEERGVVEREISNIRYRLSDSRIYHQETQEVQQDFATNESPDNNSTMTLKYEISDSTTTHWTSSVSMSLGVNVRFDVSAIPLIVNEGVELSTGISYSHGWGVPQTTQHTIEKSYTVTVPPSTRVKGTIVATKGACDVPFSYTQTDLLTTGQRVITNKDDGVYTGINSYNFNFKSTEV